MSDGQPEPETDEELEELLRFLRDARGFDFTGYKRSSLGRRIRKRMADADAASYADYRDRLETNADEFNALFNTILINVTSFFRDPEAWTFLQREVLPELLAQSGPDDEIRVWSAGCSSGEEAYSLAIMFAEALGLDETLERVKIYGTDVDEEALRDARSGLYPAKALEPLAPELRESYFEQNGARFGFRPDLRRRVIFGRHDITRDAPISRLDLLVCRNALMYFNVETQTQIVDRFHFALREGGFLFLGKAEMLLNDVDRFDVLSMRQRVFRRRPGEAAAPHVPAPVKIRAGMNSDVHTVARHRQLRDLILDATPSPAVAVDTEGTVIHVNNHARLQFGLTGNDVGRPFQDLEISYRPVELRSLIEQAGHERRTLRVNGAERRTSEDSQFFDILVQPLTGPDGLTVATNITFTDVTVATQLRSEIKRVREDLETAYEELQSTNEELETTNEELQSSIEELETTNEELQSTNEELETTNEELQSGNEELETMNEELRVRTEELDQARSFLEAVLTSIAAGVVVLDREFKVRSWSRGAVELWGLRSDEVLDRPFFGLDFGLPTEKLREAVQRCVEEREHGVPISVPAVNRLGRSIMCTVQFSPFDGRVRPPEPGRVGEPARGGVVLLMEETPATGSG
ncbi:CheR family methyltransferase [Streptomyces sp. SID13726]|uniref:CheR family methyltransferase n=1 Tax=Streptomyces sp. SID13726 TaxID=2706058 RepID=UPI0013BA692C|nr:CheR family methyltransferase [Streptomyces sp. SID13726]NEB05833.1 PAS domain-containing protein [Streptomyces sp. SID13726]